MIKLIIKYILLILVVLYLIGAFISLDFNIVNWSYDFRVILSIISGGAIVITIIGIVSYKAFNL